MIAQPGGVLVVTASAFTALVVAILLLGSLPADEVVRRALLAFAAPSVLIAMGVVKHLGYWTVIAPGTVLLLVIFRRARASWWVWVTLMIAAPVSEWALKLVVGRPRPENMSLGFPSGHATAAAAFFGAIIFLSESLSPRLRALVRVGALACIALVGVARVLQRDHWPSDVLGGIALGLALASAAALVAATVRRPPVSDT